jgi:hypothetical protein
MSTLTVLHFKKGYFVGSALYNIDIVTFRHCDVLSEFGTVTFGTFAFGTLVFFSLT